MRVGLHFLPIGGVGWAVGELGHCRGMLGWDVAYHEGLDDHSQDKERERGRRGKREGKREGTKESAYSWELGT